MKTRKQLLMSPELMETFLKYPVEPGLKANGFPVDGKIIDAFWRIGTIVLVVESELFTDDYDRLTVTFEMEHV